MTGRRSGALPRVRLLAVAGLGVLLAVCVLGTAARPALATTTFVVNRIGDQPDLNLANTKCDASSASGNQCTLRAAIQEANDTAGADTINFSITTSRKVIAPTTPLPPITGQLTINGYSQAGAQVNTKDVGSNAVIKIVLDGINAGASANGLEIQADGATLIKGLVIMRFDGSGILISGSDALIQGNFIGTSANGTKARPNGTGIKVLGTDNLIGLAVREARNVISGNETDGISFSGHAVELARVKNNYIGTQPNGTKRLANGGAGVKIVNASGIFIGIGGGGGGNVISGNGAAGVDATFDTETGDVLLTGNLIGTDATGTQDLGNGSFGLRVGFGRAVVGSDDPGEENVISGNAGAGIYLFGVHESVIMGNRIGTNSAGTAAIANDSDGILAVAADVLIGSNDAGHRNLISGNLGDGLELQSGTPVVQGNYIGTKLDGTGDLGNAGSGIVLNGAGGSSTAPGKIGGTAGGEGNVISGNGAHGIHLHSGGGANTIAGNVIKANDLDGVRASITSTTVGPGNLIFSNGRNGVAISGLALARVTANQIFGNGRLGIDIVGGTENAAGVTSNDTDDPDIGANYLQNFPVLTTAIQATNGVTTVTGSLNSNPSTLFRIELFLAVVDPSNHGEGQVLLAAQNITTNANGDKGFQFAGVFPAGMPLTATATDLHSSVFGSSTSEFSANITVVASP